MPLSPSDARLVVLRSLRSLFSEVLGADRPKGASQDEIAADEQYAEELGVEVLETLGMTVISADDDGSFLVRLHPE